MASLVVIIIDQTLLRPLHRKLGEVRRKARESPRAYSYLIESDGDSQKVASQIHTACWRKEASTHGSLLR